MLIILDGFGLGSIPEADAIQQANTPFFDQLLNTVPYSKLITHGLDVGLPPGQMGNSEVGHINLGAGRVIYQDLTRIDLAIQNKELDQNPTLQDMISIAHSNHKPIHLIGLLSNGGVHSHMDHLFALIDVFEKSLVEQIFIHAITDGRDTDPHAAKSFVESLLLFIEGKKSKLSTIIGRYYAMDRDKRWERTKLAYQLYVAGEGKSYKNALEAIDDSYRNDITDEFILPIQLEDSNGVPYPAITEQDIVFCYNFRSDRLRQLTTVLTQEDFPEFSMKALDLRYYTMTEYNDKFKNVSIVFPKQKLDQSIGEMLSRYGVRQLRIAETEKYPHVTFFFNGGREQAFSGERRILIPSPKVATYDLKPSMSAYELTDALLEDLKVNKPEFVCLNFANTDMVGHTGVFKAAMEAAETVDTCLQKIVELAKSLEYNIIILSDHGNADCMINPDGSPNTAHTKNPVPCILIADPSLRIRDGRLCDIAPTLLELMQLPVPAVMTGENLVYRV